MGCVGVGMARRQPGDLQFGGIAKARRTPTTIVRGVISRTVQMPANGVSFALPDPTPSEDVAARRLRKPVRLHSWIARRSLTLIKCQTLWESRRGNGRGTRGADGASLRADGNRQTAAGRRRRRELAMETLVPFSVG